MKCTHKKVPLENGTTSFFSASVITSLNLIPPCLRGSASESSSTSLSSCLIGTGSTPDGLVYWVDLLLVITTTAAFVYILFGAYQMVTAFGEESKFTAGRKTVTYAIVGVVIAILALVFVNIFITLLHGTPVPVNNFNATGLLDRV